MATQVGIEERAEMDLLIKTIETRYKTRWPYRYEFEPSLDGEEYEARYKWCEDNCQDAFIGLNNKWHFKDEREYLMFVLKWGK